LLPYGGGGCSAPIRTPRLPCEGKTLARKEDLLKILQEVVATLEEAERFAGDDAANSRDIRNAAFKIRAVIIRLLSK
jgi:hypothetical protein